MNERGHVGRRFVMQRGGVKGGVARLDRRTGAAVHGRATIRRGVMLARRRDLPGTLVMVLVSLGRRRSGISGDPILPMPRARNLTSPQQLWEKEKRCDKAGCATIGHDGV
jgi:hypothetical protein